VDDLWHLLHHLPCHNLWDFHLLNLDHDGWDFNCVLLQLSLNHLLLVDVHVNCWLLYFIALASNVLRLTNLFHVYRRGLNCVHCGLLWDTGHHGLHVLLCDTPLHWCHHHHWFCDRWSVRNRRRRRCGLDGD